LDGKIVHWAIGSATISEPGKLKISHQESAISHLFQRSVAPGIEMKEWLMVDG